MYNNNHILQLSNTYIMSIQIFDCFTHILQTTCEKYIPFAILPTVSTIMLDTMNTLDTLHTLHTVPIMSPPILPIIKTTSPWSLRPRKSILKKNHTLKRKVKHSVRFTDDVKNHDGLCTHHQIYNRLINHCLDFGGMASCEELITYWDVICETDNTHSTFIAINELVIDLRKRLLEINDSRKSAQILVGGGRNVSQLRSYAFDIIDHCCIVFYHTRAKLKDLKPEWFN